MPSNNNDSALGFLLVIVLAVAGVVGLGGNGNTEQSTNQTITEPTEQNQTIIFTQNQTKSKLESNVNMSFIIKAGQVSECCINPNYPARYVSNWKSLVTSMGINTIRIQTGDGGDTWGLNMFLNSDWADNLMALLDEVNSDRTGQTGLKCWFQSLGDPYLSLLGMNDLNRYLNDGAPDGTGGGTGLLNINTIKAKIDLLANEGAGNSQDHNFLTDPRILAWSVGNECTVGTVGGGLDAVGNWLIQIMDYIRSKGALVIADSPHIEGGDSYAFEHTVPYFQSHADYMEFHYYGIWELVHQFSLGGNNYNWADWKTQTQNWLIEQMSHKGSFATENVIDGEFGMWIGTATDMGTTATFTDQNRIDYYTYYFQALEVAGIKNPSFFSAFWAGPYYMITSPQGVKLDGCDTITAAYAGGGTYYIITASKDVHSTLNPSGAVYVQSGSNQGFTYSANTGYMVSSVLVDGLGVPITGNYTFTNVTATHSITVASIQVLVTVAVPVAGYIYSLMRNR